MAGLMIMVVGLFILGLAFHLKRKVISDFMLKRLMLNVWSELVEHDNNLSIELDFTIRRKWDDLHTTYYARRALQLGNIIMSISRANNRDWFAVIDCDEGASWPTRTSNLKEPKKGSEAHNEMKRVYLHRLLEVRRAIKAKKNEKDVEILNLIDNKKKMPCPCCDHKMYTRQVEGVVMYCNNCNEILLVEKKDNRFVFRLEDESNNTVLGLDRESDELLKEFEKLEATEEWERRFRKELRNGKKEKKEKIKKRKEREDETFKEIREARAKWEEENKNKKRHEREAFIYTAGG